MHARSQVEAARLDISHDATPSNWALIQTTAHGTQMCRTALDAVAPRHASATQQQLVNVCAAAQHITGHCGAQASARHAPCTSMLQATVTPHHHAASTTSQHQQHSCCQRKLALRPGPASRSVAGHPASPSPSAVHRRFVQLSKQLRHSCLELLCPAASSLPGAALVALRSSARHRLRCCRRGVCHRRCCRAVRAAAAVLSGALAQARGWPGQI